MHLLSNIDLDCNSGIAGTIQTKVKGVISFQQQNVETGDLAYIFAYIDDATGNVLETKEYPVDPATADGLYEQVKANLPDINAVGFIAWQLALDYESFRLLMAQTFGVTANEIDIIN